MKLNPYIVMNSSFSCKTKICARPRYLPAMRSSTIQCYSISLKNPLICFLCEYLLLLNFSSVLKQRILEVNSIFFPSMC